MADSVNLTWDLLARDRASRTFKNVGDAAHKGEHGIGILGKTMHKVGEIAKVGFAAGLLAAGEALHVMVDRSREAEKSARITEAHIRSTGGAANLTAKQVEELTMAISNKTGVEHESIVSGANMLLTFTHIHDEVGRGNKIFTRATQTVTDMSVALGKPPQTAAIQLGKALQDPIKGVSSLARVGVVFTQGQKDQIKALVDSGHRMQAQKLILHELGREFGGTAKAASDPMKRLHTVLQNIAETLGSQFLPWLERSASFLSDKLPGAVSTAQAKIRTFSGKVGEIGSRVVEAFDKAKPLVQAAFDKFAPDLTALVASIKTKFSAAGSQIVTAVGQGLKTGDWSTLGVVLGDGLGVAFKSAVGGGNKVASAFASIDWTSMGKKAAMAAIPFAVGLVNGLADAIVSEVMHHPLDVLQLALFLIPAGKLAGPVGKLAEKIGLPLIPGMLRGVERSGGLVSKAFVKVFRAADRALNFIAPALRRRIVSAFDTAITAIFTVADDALKAGMKVGRQIVTGVLRPFAGIADKLLTAGADLIKGFVRGIGSGFKAVKDKLGELTDKLPSWKGPPSKDRKILSPAGMDLMEGLNDGIVKGAKKIKATLATITENIKGQISDLRSQARDIASAAADSIMGVLDVSQIGQAVETTTPGKSIIDPVTGAVTQGPDVTTSTTPSAASIVANAASTAAQFVKDLATMTKKGLAPSIIAAVAAAGPVGGAAAAHAFATESVADDRSVNASAAVISKAAGQDAARARKASGIDEQIAQLKGLRRDVAKLTQAQQDGLVASYTIKGEDLDVILKRVDKRHKRAG